MPLQHGSFTGPDCNALFEIDTSWDKVDRSAKHPPNLDSDTSRDRFIFWPFDQSHLANGDFDTETLEINGDDRHAIFGIGHPCAYDSCQDLLSSHRSSKIAPFRLFTILACDATFQIIQFKKILTTLAAWHLCRGLFNRDGFLCWLFNGVSNFLLRHFSSPFLEEFIRIHDLASCAAWWLPRWFLLGTNISFFCGYGRGYGW